MAATETHRLTVEEFRWLPANGAEYQELRQGQLTHVTRPRFRHHQLQERLIDSLRAASAGNGHVSWEVAFRAVPEFELRAADVAWVTQLALGPH